MPWNEVMSKFKSGKLKSGFGKPVKNPKMAIAIMLSEKRKAKAGKREYQVPAMKLSALKRAM